MNFINLDRKFKFIVYFVYKLNNNYDAQQTNEGQIQISVDRYERLLSQKRIDRYFLAVLTLFTGIVAK